MKLLRTAFASALIACGAFAATSAQALETSYFSITPDLYTFSVSNSGSYTFEVGALAGLISGKLFNSTGTLLASDTGNLFDPVEFSASLASGSNYTFSLTTKNPKITLAYTTVTGPGRIEAPVVSAVPEPGEYVLLLAGLAAIAAVAWRHKARPAASSSGSADFAIV